MNKASSQHPWCTGLLPRDIGDKDHVLAPDAQAHWTHFQPQFAAHHQHMNQASGEMGDPQAQDMYEQVPVGLAAAWCLLSISPRDGGQLAGEGFREALGARGPQREGRKREGENMKGQWKR